MGLIRNVLTAFKPSNLARGLEAARHPPDRATIDAAVAQLDPEARARYEANMAAVRQGQAEAQASFEEAKAISDRAQILMGPAGHYLYGSTMGDFASPDQIEVQVAERGMLDVVQEMRAQRKGEFKQAVRQSFNISEVKQIDDPAERARARADELAARDAARAPYRAESQVQIAITRLATRGRTQLAEVLDHLRSSGLSARPDHVFGVYRVPDRISGPLTPGSEGGRVVEWEVVHAPVVETPGVGGAPCEATAFAAEDQWVARRVGEPSVMDEDLALAFCHRAGIGPEHCLGLARISEFRQIHAGDDGSGDLHTIVKGVVAIHPPEPTGSFRQMAGEAPLDVPDPASTGVHVEVINWDEVGRAVHPKIHHPPPVPSPFPYLPATPQEMLRAHLEVVGIQPADCYSAQATVDRPRALIQGGFFTTNLGPKQPCADGKERMRTHGCEQIVVIYRDRPEYAAGRERWAAYQRDVLQAHLERGMQRRPPLFVEDLSDLWAPLRAAMRVSDALEWWDTIGLERLPPYRYCWPPIDHLG